MHLNLYIVKSGFCSRRRAASIIKEGRVKINGAVVLEPWREVGPSDEVRVGTEPLRIKEDSELCLALNKPKGVTTTLHDKFASKKVTDLIPKSFGRVYPVGRLDKNSRGLILLTNDGNLCYRLTHPKFEVEKEYAVIVAGRPAPMLKELLIKGVRDGADLLKVKNATIRPAGVNTEIIMTISEGKKRHLRRLLSGLGMKVLDLKRIRIGNILLGNTKEGSFRIIDRSVIYDFLKK